MFMLKPKKNSDPLVIVVKGDRWDALGDSTYQRKLYTLLTKMGGIHESVEDGTYHFNIEYRRFFIIHATLTKVED